MPARMFATTLLQYHQNAMLVIRNATFTGFGRWPMIHIRGSERETGSKRRSAPNRISLLAAVHYSRRNKWPTTHVVGVERVGHSVRRKHHRRGEPDYAHCEIEPARERVERTHFRVVDAAEPVGLHQSMPDAPEENDQQDSFQVPPEKGRADCEKKKRRENKTPFETFEQCAVAIRANHSRQVMSHCAECSDEQIDFLRAPARLGQGKGRNEQQRRADIENQVAPANPESTSCASGAVAGAAGTVCGRENAVTCCMNSGAKCSVKQR